MARPKSRTGRRTPFPLSAAARAISVAALFSLIAVTPAQPPAIQAAEVPGSSQPAFTIHAQVPLTIVNVTVTDADGHPVRGLKQSDFTLTEDGHPMALNSFEEHRTDTAASVTPVPPPPPLPPNTFTNATPSTTTPNDRPLNILLIDSLNTPLANQRILQLHMLDFVKKMAPGTRVAVFNLNESHLSILQGFTSDRDLLTAAINSKKLTGQVPPVEDLWQDQMNPLQASSDPDELQCNNAALRAQDSLVAMKQIARYLGGMTGRKNLIWFSGVFQQQMEAHGAVCYDDTQDLTAADEELARAHVTIYPVDPRAMDAMAPPACAPGVVGGCLPNKAEVVQTQSIEHLTMEAIAEDTGGHAFYNNNALDQLAATALDLGSNFYTLTYTPTNQAMDTRFRTIKVTVSKPGLHLTYRNGYYAVPPEVDARGKKIETITPMQAALLRGNLDATQILFSTRVTPVAATETTLAADNTPDPRQLKPPYRRIAIAYSIDVHSIDFPQTPDGNYRASFEYGVRVYNLDGDQILNSAAKTVSPILPPSVYKSMVRSGASAHLDVDLPATGDYILRIAVHDLTSDRVGSVEVPTSSIQPAATLPQTAAAK